MFRVLLVDDEELALISLQYSFPWKEYGFTELLTTTDSGEAMSLLEERYMDAAFVDIRMPGINGLELLKLAQERGLDTVFVIVSGYSDFAYAKTAIGYGVLDYCLKPEPAAFQSALKRVRMEQEGSEEGRCGLVQFSTISDEMQSCFYSLLSYVEEHYDQSLTLQSLAQRFGIGYTYLSGQFHRATGKSFPEYLTAVRLQEACRLLTGTQLKVGDIAEKVGYGDCHYFNNVFKRQLGTTPLQYRKAARKEPEV